MSAPHDAPLGDAFRELAMASDQAETWSRLGRSLQAAGRHADAHAAFGEALRLAPDPLPFAGTLADAAIAADAVDGELAKRQGQPAGRVAAADLLIAARLLRHLHRPEEAILAGEEASTLAPNAAAIAAELAEARFGVAQDAQAEKALTRALELDPTNGALRHKLGMVLLRLGRPAAARPQLAACLDVIDEAIVLSDLALAELQLGRQNEARAAAEGAITKRETDPEAHRLLATILAYTDGVSGAELTDALKKAGALHLRDQIPPLDTERDPNRRLRLGFLGGAFWRHPSSWLTIRGIEGLDANQFEIHCFSPDLVEDTFTARWKALAAGWHVTRGKSDEAVARMVRIAKIDILVDLGGYLNNGRMTVMAHRAAPIQIKWVGAQFHTTGFPEIDVFVTDRYETPIGLEALYTENLLFMPESYVCYDPPAASPDVGPLPADRNGFVTFGSFNNLMKITPAVLDAWSEILGHLDRACLHVRAPQFDEDDVRQSFLASFATRGIEPTRVHLSGTAEHMVMLAAYNDVDIALQPFPYCGGVTLLEGLFMGVPSVASCGETFASRHGISHLSQVGLADFLAGSRDAYVALAIEKAKDPPRLRGLRATLRHRLVTGTLCDGTAFGTALGPRLRTLWTQYCASSQRPRT